MNHPETRASLLLRIRDQADREAWFEFEEIYRPVIQRLARLKGLQPADADDLAQQVLLSVSGAIDRWQPDGEAKFRTWLKRVAENAILNAITRGNKDRLAGDSTVKALVDAGTQRNDAKADSQILRIEFRREVFNWAAARVKNQVDDTTWQAFWLTAVEHQSVEQVSGTLHKKRGTIYAARSRVMKRLRKEVKKFED